jgi:hypothetical protein
MKGIKIFYKSLRVKVIIEYDPLISNVEAKETAIDLIKTQDEMYK